MRAGGRTLAVLGLGLTLLTGLLTGCTNTPPPPVVSSSAPPPTTSPVRTPSQIVVGMDDIVGGYNPHNLADSSTVTSALAQLLLPSVFRETGKGEPELDARLMRSASVISEQPFTVAYEIRPDASWSDGAPIAVEDFVYLADAMRDQSGTVQPAGYRLISGIQPGEGGKRVEVTFSEPYPGWRTLFSDLLPAHLLKDAPGGFQGALEGSFPAYGGPFSVKTLDRDRGEIILERNDRYWEKPAAIDRVVLRRADQAGMAGALRSGNDQFALARTDSTGLKLFTDLGDEVQLHTVARPVNVNLLLRPAGGPLSDEKTRAGVAALIDRAKLITEGVSGGASAALTADALVTPHSAPGYAATRPPSGQPGALDGGKAESLLKAAGYAKEAGTWRRNGKPLTLVVASPGQQQPYADIADALSSQLIAAGVEVRTISPQPRELFATTLAMPLPSGQSGQPGGQTAPADGSGAVGVDIAVVPQPVGGDPATVLASTFGCRPNTTEGQQAATTPANPAAFCSSSLQPTIESALTGATSAADALSTLEPQLWRKNVVIPLFQLADTMAISKSVSGVTPGPPLAGPFGSAVDWTRAGS